MQHRNSQKWWNIHTKIQKLSPKPINGFQQVEVHRHTCITYVQYETVTNGASITFARQRVADRWNEDD